MALLPYAAALPYIDPALVPAWATGEDGQRLAAYDFYERMYWNIPDTLRLAIRGSDSDPLYLPTPRTMVEATNRFLAKHWNYVVDPQFGTPADQTVVTQMLRSLFRREQVYTKFGTQKRYGLIRGDAVWHITADDTKPEGKRISMHDVSPGTYFPVQDPDNAERVRGVYLVDVTVNGKDLVNRVQKYVKLPNGLIQSTLALYTLGKWDDRYADTDPNFDPATVEQVAVVKDLTLPPTITALPVYLIRNQRNSGTPFGNSELRGMERVIAGIDQTISDNEIALALQGLGVYVTTSGPPTDEDGNETNWRLGPGRVVEIDDESTFTRIQGISTVQPVLDHLHFVMGSMQQAIGVPDIAAGNVDVTVAESGISLYLQLSPLLAKNEEKETEMLSVYDQMLYDLVQMWFPAYEALPAGIAVDVVSEVQDPLPVNRDNEIKNIISLATSVPPIISVGYAQAKLRELGYEFPADMLLDIVQEQTAFNEARFGDPFGGRSEDEIQDTVNQ
jgi:hypothetical protein